jgi:hypothetical protein
MLQNGACYKTIRVTKRYALQNGTHYSTVTFQKGRCYTMVCYKTVTVTEWYITKQYDYKTVRVTKWYGTLMEQVNRSSSNLLEISFTGKR